MANASSSDATVANGYSHFRKWKALGTWLIHQALHEQTRCDMQSTLTTVAIIDSQSVKTLNWQIAEGLMRIRKSKVVNAI